MKVVDGSMLSEARLGCDQHFHKLIFPYHIYLWKWNVFQDIEILVITHKEVRTRSNIAVNKFIIVGSFLINRQK